MQKFGPDESVTTQEAQQILAAWADRRQAHDVDASAGSVSSLASGLGVSEDEVRRMLEDIRVQKRSQELAAGIVNKQLEHRKRSDINAAIIAAAVLLVLIVIGAGCFMFVRGLRHHGSNIDTTIETGPDGTMITGPNGKHTFIRGGPGLPTNIPPSANVNDDSSALYVSPLGYTTNISPGEYIHVGKDGSRVHLSGAQAVTDEINKQIPVLKKQIDELTQKKNPSDQDTALLNDTRDELSTLQHGLELQKNASSTTPPPPAVN